MIVTVLILGFFIYVYLSTEKSDSKETDKFPNLKMNLRTDKSSYPQGTTINITYIIKNEMDINITPDKYVWKIYCILKEDYENWKEGRKAILIGFPNIEVTIPKGENYYGSVLWTHTENVEKGEYYIIFIFGEWLDRENELIKPLKEVKIEVTIT